MQIVELNLSHYNLFCPATGQQVLDPEQFSPSMATVFCYLDGESEMSFALPWLVDAFEECKEITKTEAPLMSIPPGLIIWWTTI